MSVKFNLLGQRHLLTFIFQQTEENNLQAAKRRAEREAVDYRQRVLRFASLFIAIGHLGY
jgi:hypothetical protein